IMRNIKRLISISVLIIFLSCSKERKQHFPHYSNDESALNELFLKYPSIPPYYEINLDSINRLKVFNEIYKRELTIEDYLDSIKYTIYSGGISESSTTYKLIVINYENLNTAIPFISSNGYS